MKIDCYLQIFNIYSKMVKCKGSNKTGKKCNAIADNNGYCRWHRPSDTITECLVCYEIFQNEKELPCGHSIHIECVQKSADALQDIRTQDGFPPIDTCCCPICRRPVPGLKPKQAQPVKPLAAIHLDCHELNHSYTAWETSDRIAPLSWYLWIAFSEKYPEFNPEELIDIAGVMEDMIILGVINPLIDQEIQV